MQRNRCAAISLAAKEPIHATAPHRRAILAVAHDGPWSDDPVSDLGLDGKFRARVQSLGIGLLLIRPGSGRTSDGLTCFAIRPDGDRTLVRRRTLDSYDDLLALDLEALVAGKRFDAAHEWEHWRERVFFVCTHARRDRCCGQGVALARALAERHPEAVWWSSHIGGHRFAPVLLTSDGLCFGRIASADDAAWVAEALAGGMIPITGFYRGNVAYPRAVQAAEVMLLRRLDTEAIGALRLAQPVEEAGDVARVQMLDRRGRIHAIRVRFVRTGVPRPLGCGDPPDDPGFYEEVVEPARPGLALRLVALAAAVARLLGLRKRRGATGPPGP